MEAPCKQGGGRAGGSVVGMAGDSTGVGGEGMTVRMAG